MLFFSGAGERVLLAVVLKSKNNTSISMDWSDICRYSAQHEWDSILWSDEITVFGTNGFKTVWLRKGEDFKEKCMVPTVKYGGGSVLMWGCMLLVLGSCISLIVSWTHRCTALYWKRRCYHHSMPLVVMHFSNMTMIQNTHLKLLLHFWRWTGWRWLNGQVCLLIWTQLNTYGEFWRNKLSITLHPASRL